MLRIARCRWTPRLTVHARYISNYYRLFPETLPDGPPPKGKFDVDVKQLRNEYLRAQRQAHPDVAGGDSQVNSAELSSAFRVLRDPIARAEHILTLKGANPLEEGAGTLEDEDLLMDIMMSREFVSEAESKDELEPIIAQTNEKLASLERAVGDALERDDVETAQKKLIELTYVAKLQQAADQKKEEL